MENIDIILNSVLVEVLIGLPATLISLWALKKLYTNAEKEEPTDITH